MNTRYRLALYALLLIFLSKEAISLARVENWSHRRQNTTQNNNWQSNPGIKLSPVTAGNRGPAGWYSQQNYGNNTIRNPGSSYVVPMTPPSTPRTNFGQNQPHSNWNQLTRNSTRPINSNSNRPTQPTPSRPQNNFGINPNGSYRSAQNQQNSNWNQFIRNATRPVAPNSNSRTNPYMVPPTTQSSRQNNFGSGGQGFGTRQPQNTGNNVHQQNQSLPTWGGSSNTQTNWNAYKPGGSSHLYPSLQPLGPHQAAGNRTYGSSLPNVNSGGAALAPIGGVHNPNSQWNGNTVPNTSGDLAPLAPFGGGIKGNNGNTQWNTGNNNWPQTGNLGGSAGNIPLAPLSSGGSQWNTAGGGGQASLSYGNGQQFAAGQQQNAAKGGSSNPYANLFN